MKRRKKFNRKPMSRGKSKRNFRKAAKRVHKKNVSPRAMRGGIRL
jgi:lysylphosphatidylglycerol synthetase-like protein (DUF2156 family)